MRSAPGSSVRRICDRSGANGFRRITRSARQRQRLPCLRVPSSDRAQPRLVLWINQRVTDHLIQPQPNQQIAQMLLGLQGAIATQRRQFLVDQRAGESVISPHASDLLNQVNREPNVQPVGGHRHRPWGPFIGHGECQSVQNTRLVGPWNVDAKDAVRQRRVIRDAPRIASSPGRDQPPQGPPSHWPGLASAPQHGQPPAPSVPDRPASRIAMRPRS